MSVTLLWYFAKRTPKFIVILLNFITIFLTIFLLVGCYNEQNNSTFLVKYQFNKDSSFYPVIQNSFTATGNNKTQGLDDIIIRSGYMGVCIDNVPHNYNLQGQNLESVCYPRKNISNTPLYNDLVIELSGSKSVNSTTTTKSKTSLNILKLAQVTSVNVIHPYILIATIILTIIQFITVSYTTVPGLPFKYPIEKFTLILSLTLTLVWGMGATWVHIGVHSAVKFIPEASMQLIKVKKGKKAASMTWFAFAFFVVISCISLFTEWQASRTGDVEPEEIMKNKNKYETNNDDNYNYHYYSSDGSVYGTKA